MTAQIERSYLTKELITLDDLWKVSWRRMFILDAEPPGTTWEMMRSNHVEAIPRYYELTLKEPIIFEKMSSIKRAVLSYPWRLEGEDESVTDFCHSVLDDDKFNLRSVLSFLVDAAFYGFTVGEILWGVRDGRWVIERIIERPPTLFAFNRLMYPQVGPLGILRPGSVEPEPVPPFKFVVYTYEPDEGDRTGTPLLREVFWPAWIAREAAKLMLKMAEKGSGTVTVTYSQPPGTQITDESGATTTIAAQAQRLAEAIANGTAVSHGDAYTVQLLEKARQGDASVFREIVDWAERRIHLVFTGETLTARGGDEGSGSYALGQVHLQIRNEKPISISRDIESVLRLQVLRPLVELNFGPNAPVPRFVIETPREEPRIENWHLQEGVVSPNEVRKTLKLAPRKGLDELRRPGPLAPPLGAEFDEFDPWARWR
jgi:phage gp29-like protein